MSDRERIAESVSTLINGWDEHIEYAIRVVVHVNGCSRRNCLCTDRVEARARTMHYPGLLSQLEEAASIPSSAGPSSGGSSNKPGSRPPGNMASLLLIDTINEEARFWYSDLWFVVKGTPAPSTARKTLPELLLMLVLVADQAHEHPGLVHELSGSLHKWINKARIMLGYAKPYVQLASTTCHQCGGALAVASDASTDVRCVGTPTDPACGHVYRRENWLELLP